MIGEGDDPVKVIGHGKNQSPTPFASRFPENNRFHDFLPYCHRGKLVATSRQAIDGDEKRFLSRVDPVRHIMRQL